MKNFVSLYQNLDQASASAEAKVNAFVQYFEAVEDDEILCALSLFLIKPPKRIATLVQLKEWALAIIEIPNWLFEESLKVSGALSEVLAILFDKSNSDKNYSLSFILAKLKSLEKENDGLKKSTIFEMWSHSDIGARIIINKLLSGGFRLKVDNKVIVGSLSVYLDLPQATISHRLNEKWTLESTTFKELLIQSSENEEHSRPYPLCSACALEEEIEYLGDASDWTAEYKWNGVRAQIIKRNEEVFIWSGQQELITDKVPEINSFLAKAKGSFVIEGQIMAWKENKPMPYAQLEKRIHKKTINKKMILETPVVFIGYDILEYSGEDIRSKSYEIRRGILESIISTLPTESPIVFSNEIKFKQWKGIYTHRNQCREMGAKGLMIKKLDSPYNSEIQKEKWWKWKAEPFKITAVLLYATRGRGGLSGIYSDFTMAVKKGDNLATITKVNEGLSDEEIKEVSAFISKNTVESFGPVRSVKPQLVFEVTFEGISKSTRHKSGVIISLPKISMWNREKSPDDITTLKELTALL